MSNPTAFLGVRTRTHTQARGGFRAGDLGRGTQPGFQQQEEDEESIAESESEDEVRRQRPGRGCTGRRMPLGQEREAQLTHAP